MAADEIGFQVSFPRRSNMTGLRGRSFYVDTVHPDGNTGARYVGKLIGRKWH